MIRLTVPSIDEAEFEAVREVLKSGFLVQGTRVAGFEQAVRDHVGAKFAIAVQNGTAALHLALLVLDVGPGDVVITTAYSWPATANVIELCGAHPVFVDIQPDTFNLDPKCLETTLERLAGTGHLPRVKAVIPVHTFGQLADMPAITGVALRYGVPIIEDAACALGASIDGRPAGSWGLMACFSFHPRKAVTTAEGGIVATNDARLASRLRALRNHGLDPDGSPGDFIVPGYNYRLTELQAAVGIAQMTKLSRIIEARRHLAAVYDTLLAGTQIIPPTVAPSSEPVFQSYVTLLPDQPAMGRDEVIRRLRTEGIETTIGTWHIPLTPYYRRRYGFARGVFPWTDSVFDRTLTLPLHERISRDEQEMIVRALVASVTQPAG